VEDTDLLCLTIHWSKRDDHERSPLTTLAYTWPQIYSYKITKNS